MERGSAITSASYLSTIGWIPSGPMHLWQSRCSSRSLTLSTWIVGCLFCSWFQSCFEYLQRWRLQYLPEQAVPVVDHNYYVYLFIYFSYVFQFVRVASCPLTELSWDESGSVFFILPIRYFFTLKGKKRGFQVS